MFPDIWTKHGEAMSSKRERKQINIRLERELHDFLVDYAKGEYKTVTAVVREMIAGLYKAHQESRQEAKRNETPAP